MKYTQLPTDLLSSLQFNAGILAFDFDLDTGEVANILGATSGGIQISDTPQWVDLGDDIDNCPKNTKEMKMIDYRDVKATGTFVSLPQYPNNPLIPAMIFETENKANGILTTMRPQNYLNNLRYSSYQDIWWIGDYSDPTSGTSNGFIAIHFKNVLNTAGFSLQTTDKGKGQFSFEFSAHYSLDNIDEVPYTMYILNTSAGIYFARTSITLKEGHSESIVGRKYPETASVRVASSDSTVATATSQPSSYVDLTVDAISEGTAILIVSLTYNGEVHTTEIFVTVLPDEDDND